MRTLSVGGQGIMGSHNVLPSSEEGPRTPSAACGLRKAKVPSHTRNRPALQTVLIPKGQGKIITQSFSE